MIDCSSDMELRLSYETGILDGLMVAANVVGGCRRDMECMEKMVSMIYEIALGFAKRRSVLFTSALLDRIAEE